MTKSLAHAAAWGAILRATLGQAEPSQEELLDHPGDWTSEDALYRWEELDLKKLISVEEEEERDLWPIRSNKKCLRKDESDYRGRVAVTISGRPCQAWSSQLPHQHRNTPENRGDSGVAHHNFCRNPGGSEQGAWCYTIDKRVRWERCDVRCGSSKPEKVNANCIAGSAYRGRISTTKTGKSVSVFLELCFFCFHLLFIFVFICEGSAFRGLGIHFLILRQSIRMSLRVYR